MASAAGVPPRSHQCFELGGRARLDADALGILPFLVGLVLDHRSRPLGAGTLYIDQVPELLVDALLAPLLAARPQLMTHLRPPPSGRGSPQWSHLGLFPAPARYLRYGVAANSRHSSGMPLRRSAPRS